MDTGQESPIGMNVLIACEFSGTVREAFARRGHNAWSCDLLESEREGNHIQGDVLQHLAFVPFEKPMTPWDLLIAHPPCTYLCNASVGRFYYVPRSTSPGVLYGKERWKAMEQAAAFFRKLLDAPIAKKAIENPVMHGYAGKLIGIPPSQTVQPYQFGENASKRTCLWLVNLPLLTPTKFIEPRIVNGKKLWANQTNSGQNKLTPSPTRAQDRARTYQGIADAMAKQWT